MAALDIVYAGEFKTLVEIYEYSYTKNEASENVKTLIKRGRKFVKRIDVGGNEENDGRLIPLDVVRYIMRFDKNFLKEGTKYIIRDQDGDYEVNNVRVYGSKRNKFLEIKASHRGFPNEIIEE